MPREKPKLTETLDEAMRKFPHLREYVRKIEAEIGTPEFHVQLSRDMRDIKFPNIIYPVGDPIFIGIYRSPKDNKLRYHAIQPELSPEEEQLYREVEEELIKIAHTKPVPHDIKDITPILIDLLNRVVEISEEKKIERKKKKFFATIFSEIFRRKIKLTKEEYEKIKYFLIRDRVGYGFLEPVLRDPYIEDIHCTGVGPIFLVHKVFGMLKTNLVFRDDLELNRYIIQESERVERPVSEVTPIVDAIMPDGSRVNIIYGREISLEGSSFTIRKFSEVPISITQLVKWGTLSSEMAAYLWLCLQHGMSMFVCGETASGKTTTLNASVAFIKPDAKIYTVENTPEVKVPHEVWQHLCTRESGKETDVTLMDLLIAALRSRPDYIIVGEIRSVEGNVAFQAMQTGHPVLSTFHAGGVSQMIQRLTGDPINVPMPAIDNLNIVLIQQAVYIKGKFLRRVLSVTELERYYDEFNKVSTKQVFEWDSSKDVHIFRGWHNSYILEEKIAKVLGYDDPREIYDELKKRAKIIETMVEKGIFDYYEVWNIIKNYVENGVLPFEI
ncbi:MAG: hypothetical protein DRO65_00125 [Candidatus Altiarchaeales archaeon]|nr:MAG: hypothetical protein DRO65_00125 [Candidatus Altiarchaeales archaeon]